MANTHQRVSRFQREPTIRQVDHHTQSAQFPNAHLDHRHRMSRRTPRRQVAPVTFLSVTYTCVPASGRYGKSGMGRADRAASRSMEDQRGDTVPANVVNQQQSPDP